MTMTPSPDPDVRRAHRLLDAARAGAHVSERAIMRCLRDTGDLSSTFLSEADGSGASVDMLHKTLLKTAKQILREQGVEGIPDDFAIAWAEVLMRDNGPRAAALGCDAETPADLES